MSGRPYVLGIDLGTAYTAAAVSRGGRSEIVPFSSAGAVMPTVVVLRDDGEVLVGDAAERRSLTEPGRTAREFKRRMGDATPIIVGETPYGAEALAAHVLRAVADEVAVREGGRPQRVVLTHPASWGLFKLDLLRQAAAAADLGPVEMVSEPEAAAAHYAGLERIEVGQVVAVYDLGGGTFDAAVLRRTEAGFQTLGTPEGIERFGGIDVDRAVLGHVDRCLDGLLTEQANTSDPAVRMALARLRDDARAAKEALSNDSDATIPVMLPSLATDVRITRGELEAMLRPRLIDTVDTMERTLRSAGMTWADVGRVLTVGGSSRMPIVREVLRERSGRLVSADAQPKHAVALGAADVAAMRLRETMPSGPVTPPAPPPRAAAAPTPAGRPPRRRRIAVVAGVVALAVAAGTVSALTRGGDDGPAVSAAAGQRRVLDHRPAGRDAPGDDHPRHDGGADVAAGRVAAGRDAPRDDHPRHDGGADVAAGQHRAGADAGRARRRARRGRHRLVPGRRAVELRDPHRSDPGRVVGGRPDLRRVRHRPLPDGRLERVRLLRRRRRTHGVVVRDTGARTVRSRRSVHLGHGSVAVHGAAGHRPDRPLRRVRRHRCERGPRIDRGPGAAGVRTRGSARPGTVGRRAPGVHRGCARHREATMSPAGAAVPATLAAVATVARSIGRDDLADRVDAAAARAGRPATFVAVLGEFKEGKSSLVNALLDREVCPVDDDIATAVVTVVTHGVPDGAILHLRGRHGPDTEAIPLAGLAAAVTEQSNPGNVRQIERAEVHLDHPLLAQGLTLVDTPGMGGIAAGHAEATLAFLPFADALLFVTDAAAELSAPEREWIAAARDRCPVIIPVLTKTDLHPQWQRIAEIDTGHLRSAGVSSTLMTATVAGYQAGRRLGDDELVADSGIPRLRQVLSSRVVDPARARSGQYAVTETRRVVRQLVEGLTLELRALGSSTEAAAAKVEIQRATARLTHLRGPGAKWSQLLGDRCADISSEASFRFRGDMRELGRTMEERIEQIATTEEWDSLATTQQAELARSIGDLFASVEARFIELRADIEQLVADDLGLGAGDAGGVDVGRQLADLWRDRQLAVVDQQTGVGGKTTTALRSAQSGLMMMGFLGQMLPAAAGALLLSSPISLALAGYFAGKAVVDGRKRAITMRRMQARQISRKLIDDVQFEMNQRLTDLVRARQREVRDQVGARLAELQRTYGEDVTTATARAANDATARTARVALLKEAHATLRTLDAELAAAGKAAA